jgi:hypothetical protein
VGVDKVTKLLGGGGVINRNGKVVDLAQKENLMSIDGASADAGLVGGRDKAQVLEDRGDMAFLETRRFGMAS